MTSASDGMTSSAFDGGVTSSSPTDEMSDWNTKENIDEATVQNVIFHVLFVNFVPALINEVSLEFITISNNKEISWSKIIDPNIGWFV